MSQETRNDATTNSVGLRLKTLVLEEELMQNHELSLTEKLVLAYIQQISPYADYYDCCDLFLDISHGDVVRAKRHLSELGYLEEENGI